MCVEYDSAPSLQYTRAFKDPVSRFLATLGTVGQRSMLTISLFDCTILTALKCI